MRIGIITAALLASRLFAQVSEPEKEAKRAQELVAAGKVEEAIRIYRQLVQDAPGNPVLLTNLCVAEYTAKHYAEAAVHAAAALRLQPDLLPARLFLGASQLELGQYVPAIDSLQLVVTAEPRERNGQLMLGEALLRAGRPAAALDHLRVAAGLLPKNPRVWYGLGRVYEALGQSSEANDAWARLTQLSPSLESHLHAAESHSAAQRWRQAALEWQEALRLAEDKPPIRISLAEALFRSRDYQAAMSALQPLLKNESADVQFFYGASLLNLQQPLEALPYLRAAIARNAELLPARAALGQALLQTGRAADAIPLLESAMPVDQDGSIHFQLFRAYQLTHRESDARRAMTELQRFRASLGGRP